MEGAIISKTKTKGKLFRNIWLASVVGFFAILLWIFGSPQNVSENILFLVVLFLFATAGIGIVSFLLWIISILNLGAKVKILTRFAGIMLLPLVALVLIVKIFLIDLTSLSGNSMFPNFRDRDSLAIDTLTYRFQEPKRGDVIIYRKSDKGDQISRIIGLPNEKILVKGGEVFVNGSDKALPEPYAVWFEGREDTPTIETALTQNEYLVLNDNRYFVADTVTKIQRRDIKGKVFYRLWPTETRGLIKN